MAIPLSTASGPARHGILLLRSEDASAGGLFLDVRPWVLGGLAVLGLSILFWVPFVIGITRYGARLSRTTGRIAEGNFGTCIGSARRDELGVVGRSIERMAAKLGHLVNGQKRFPADVSHELCAPPARIKTGPGVPEHHRGEGQKHRFEEIEQDADEPSALVEELLTLIRCGSMDNERRTEVIELGFFAREIADRD